VTTILELLLLAAAGVVALSMLARGEGRVAAVATPVLFGALVLAAWQIACVGFGIPRVLLPAPLAVVEAIWRSLPILTADFVQTVAHAVLIGWVIGCGAGLFAAIALDRSEFLRRGVLPLGSLVSAMPIVGIAPIMVMWFGFDWQSKAAVIVVMTFFPMLVNATAGLEATGTMERDLMHSYGAGYWQTLIKLRLPNALPFIFNALKLNSTLALIGGIVAEFFGTPIVGMGFRISTEVARMNLDVVWAEITLAALVGSLSFAALALIERAATFWHPSFRQ
jgi:NitT/TauT family transport system permease protein